MKTIMRGNLLCCLGLLLCLTTVGAQEKKRLKLTPQACVFTTWMSDEVFNRQHGAGWGCGIETLYGLNEIYSVGLGLLYTREYIAPNVFTACEQHGGRTQFYIIDKNRINSGRITIPLLMDFQVIPGLELKAGLQASLLPSAQAKGRLVGNYYYEQMTETQVPVEREIHEEIYDQLKVLTFEVPLGVSYEWKSFVLDARYHFGLSHMKHGVEATRSYLMLSLGYRLIFPSLTSHRR